MIETIKRLLGLESFCKKYARSQGYEIKTVKNIGFDLYRGDELIGKFPSELAASSEIYYLAAAQKHLEQSGGW